MMKGTARNAEAERRFQQTWYGDQGISSKEAKKVSFHDDYENEELLEEHEQISERRNKVRNAARYE